MKCLTFLCSIFIEERFEQLTKGIDMLNLLSSEEISVEDSTYDKTSSAVQEHHCTEDTTNLIRCSYQSTDFSTPKKMSDNGKGVDNQLHEVNLNSKDVIQDNTAFDVNQETTDFATVGESGLVIQDNHDNSVDEVTRGRQSERRIPEAVLPLMRCRLYESSESSASFQGSPSEDRNFRSDMDEVDLEEPSSSGQEDSSVHSDILEWAKVNGHGSLQIICEYYQLQCPARGSKIVFQPLEHLYPVEFHRPGETVLHIADSTIDLRSCNTSLEVAEVHSAYARISHQFDFKWLQ
ncbi:putative DENN domain-containing protein [Cocos nucifera]|uniref:Putative DENN domain-containing protein n=1 Tax=Cocos nucifera TaxID=13894 RepID=A0A8K0I2W6_COCNU|nr:putative DENN domain-containing protein [Cocos nucifera]